LSFTVSEYCRRELKEHYNAPPRHVEVLSNGVDTGRFVPQPDASAYLYKKYGIEPGTALILFVGRFAARKGLPYLLQAFAHLGRERNAGAHLLLTGEGPLRAQLAAQAERQGIANKLTFTGKLDVDDLVRHYAGATVFVLPSSYEGQGIVLLEAMACGLPCIATNNSAIPELVIPGETGYLVEYGKVEELSRAFAHVLDDGASRQRMAENARKRILQEYDWQYLAQKLVGYYSDVLRI
jgi:glycosyltransferase involved in cell wall biosynthesis